MQKRIVVRTLLGGLLLGTPLLAPHLSAYAAAAKPALSPLYDHWLNAEVTYLINSDERSLFLGLHSDQERDKFMEQFWRVRNPDPSGEGNSFKDEHYRRLAYANDHFGHPGEDDGWRTDEGMTYITLGPPQQKQRFHETPELKPMEIWFYESPSTILPSHFYLIFFKMSAIEDYKIYSPYIDHPQKLINSLNAINDDKSAIKLIQRDTNDEVAHISLSLIPGEPVDLRNPTPTLDSDVLINQIRNFRNLPQNRDLLGARRAAQESVSHRVLFGPESSTLGVIATRDSATSASIHYLLSLQSPGTLALTPGPEGTTTYSLEVKTQVATPGGKTVYSSAQTLTGPLDHDKSLDAQKQCFGIEGRIPMAPGKYQVTVTLKNLVNQQSYTQQRTVLVPAFDTSLALSQIFIATPKTPERVTAPLVPFSFAGVRLAPLGGDNVSVAQGTPLRLILQVWEPPTTTGKPRSGVLDVHYLIGKLAQATRQEEDQDVDKGTFDASGNLLLGKELPTKELNPGNYRLVVRVSDPETKATAYQSLNFVVEPEAETPALWTLLVPPAAPKK